MKILSVEIEQTAMVVAIGTFLIIQVVSKANEILLKILAEIEHIGADKGFGPEEDD